MSDYVKRRLFHGFICMHILHHAQKEPVYGSWMVQELAHHGYQLSYGTLYPMLHALENEGYLVSTAHNVEGKIRKYYSITEMGEQELKDLKKYLLELSDEIMEDDHE